MDLFGEDRWSDDSDDEQNETPPLDVDNEFAKSVLKTKHTLYDTTVLSPDIDEDNAQNNELLNEYLKHMNKVYVLAVISQNGKKNARNLDEFPKGAQEAIHHTLEWLETFFSKNQIPDTIPYTHYIRNQFQVYPFIQDNSFMNVE